MPLGVPGWFMRSSGSYSRSPGEGHITTALNEPPEHYLASAAHRRPSTWAIRPLLVVLVAVTSAFAGLTAHGGADSHTSALSCVETTQVFDQYTVAHGVLNNACWKIDLAAAGEKVSITMDIDGPLGYRVVISLHCVDYLPPRTDIALLVG